MALTWRPRYVHQFEMSTGDEAFQLKRKLEGMGLADTTFGGCGAQSTGSSPPLAMSRHARTLPSQSCYTGFRDASQGTAATGKPCTKCSRGSSPKTAPWRVPLMPLVTLSSSSTTALRVEMRFGLRTQGVGSGNCDLWHGDLIKQHCSGATGQPEHGMTEPLWSRPVALLHVRGAPLNRSDNGDGTGMNWLGMQLMLIREEHRGKLIWSWSQLS